MLEQISEASVPADGNAFDSAESEPLSRHPARSTHRLRAWGKPLRVVVSVGIFSWLAWKTDWAQIAVAFQRLRIEYWFASLAVCFLMQLLSGLRWQLLARPLGFHGSVWRFTAFYFIGMYFNLLLPTSVGGDVVRALYLNGRGHRRLPAFLTVLVDRATGLLILLLVACIGVIVSPIPLKSWIVLSVGGMTAVALIGLLLLRPATRWTRRFERLRRLRDYAKFYLRLPKLMFSTSIISLGVQAANVISVWLLDLALGLNVSPVYYWIVVPLVCILTLLPVSIAGVGVREASIVLLLAPLGVSRDMALCLSMLWFSVLLATGAFGGIIYLFGKFPKPDQQIEPRFTTTA